jgi:hypothetical protein
MCQQTHIISTISTLPFRSSEFAVFSLNRLKWSIGAFLLGGNAKSLGGNAKSLGGNGNNFGVCFSH